MSTSVEVTVIFAAACFPSAVVNCAEAAAPLNKFAASSLTPPANTTEAKSLSGALTTKSSKGRASSTMTLLAPLK